MKVLILDDSKTCLETFRRKLIGAVVICTDTASDCIKELETNENFDFILLYHDLEGKTYVPSGPGTGYEVALWLKNHPEKKHSKIILHTCNEYGAAKMKEELPEAVYLSGLFMIDFGVSDLDNIEEIHHRMARIFDNPM